MAYADGKYADEDWLREQYREKALSQKEIAEKTEVTQTTVSNWIDKFDLARKWRDEELLRELYVEKGLNTVEIAEKLNGVTSHQTINENLRKNDIEVIEQGKNSYGWGTIKTNITRGGHVRVQHCYDNETHEFRLHRLTAVAEYGLEPATEDGTVIHHKNCIGWDNRPSNLKVMDRAEHTILHDNPRQLRSLDPEWDAYDFKR